MARGKDHIFPRGPVGAVYDRRQMAKKRSWSRGWYVGHFRKYRFLVIRVDAGHVFRRSVRRNVDFVRTLEFAFRLDNRLRVGPAPFMRRLIRKLWSSRHLSLLRIRSRQFLEPLRIRTSRL